MARARSNNESNILDYLNEDCWRAVLDYVPVQDIIRTERTSRRWQDVVLTYLRSVRIVMQGSPGDRGTRKHRHARLLMLDNYCWINKLGPSVVSARCYCNRTLKLIRENCPNLEDLTLLEFGDVIEEDESFKCLRRICFLYCSIPVEDCISRLLCNDTLEELEICGTPATGQCLIYTQCTNLKSLILKYCPVALQSRYLLAATCLGQLTTFELHDMVDCTVREEIHLSLDKMPNLERLCVEGGLMSDTSFESVCRLRHLKDLQVDFEVTDEDLEAVTRLCLELKILRLNSCTDVTGRGVEALCRNAGARLTELFLGWCPHLMDDDVAIICSWPKLEVLHLRRCEKLTSAVLPRAAAARRALGVRSPLHLVGEFEIPNEEYKELEYHKYHIWFSSDCNKCNGYTFI